jgi:hypothetical protein
MEHSDHSEDFDDSSDSDGSEDLDVDGPAAINAEDAR